MMPRGYRRRQTRPPGVRAVTTVAVAPTPEEITTAYQSAMPDARALPPRATPLGRSTPPAAAPVAASAAGTCPRSP